MPRLALILSLLAQPMAAAEFPTLRAALRQLQGNASLGGTADYSLWIRTKDGGDVREEQGQIRLSWSAGNDGVKLTFPKSLLDQAEREQRGRRIDPDSTTPTRNAIFNFDALEVAEAVDFATTLLRELEGAELLNAEPGLLTFKLSPRLARTERKHVRRADVEMRVWLGSDGIPTMVERTIRIRASFFFLRFETGNTDHWQLRRHAGRLIAIRHDSEDTTAGLTRSVTARATTILTIQ